MTTIKPAKDPQFPRSKKLPSQSPLFWVAEKERYLRQLAIADIQEITGRYLIVYFADCAVPFGTSIDATDDVYLHEILQGIPDGSPVDLLIETNGGYTDATEKFVTLLRSKANDLRVIVPRKAKSNGTLIALSGGSIVMGPASELGPIDPILILGPNAAVPVHIILRTPPERVDPFIFQSAVLGFEQTRRLATSLLSTGMMTGKKPEEIEAAVNALATRDQFPSHGSVIDADEAARLGLKVERLSDQDELWRWFWLLRCMYEQDAIRMGLVKVFESERISNAVRFVPPIGQTQSQP